MTSPGEAFERGDRLGQYEVIGRLSVGGMAELYLASLAGQGGFRKFVALKRVLPSVAEQESFVKMFLDEARITASLSHANIAQVFELVETPENAEPVLAMEYVAGHNLAQITYRARARQVALAPGFSCRVVHDVLLGLHFAHHFVEPVSGRPMPVIHRDINPRNIMVTYMGGTKIVDFGIAKARGRLDQTMVGIVKGTLQYMSPEQVNLKELDGRSDLFAISVVLYELLSGKRLFDDPSESLALERIAQADVPSLATVAPTLPGRLVEVVMKGLARRPDDRWKSGRDYARALALAFPELFDDEQVAGLMSRLFADTIEASRALLQSTGGEVSVANLTLMARANEEAEPAPSPSRPPPIDDVPTMRSRQKLDTTASARPRVQDVELAETVNERPVPQVELPTDLGPPSAASEGRNTSATVVMDTPLASASGGASALTEVELQPVVTSPVSEGVRTTPAPAVVEGVGRRPAAGVRAQAAQRESEGRRPTREAQPAQRGPPIADASTLRRPTAAGAPAIVATPQRPTSGAPIVGGEQPRDATWGLTGDVEAHVPELPTTVGVEKPAEPAWWPWVALVVTVLALLTALTLSLLSGGAPPH
jgi:serine/threonine-protein kinase